MHTYKGNAEIRNQKHQLNGCSLYYSLSGDKLLLMTFGQANNFYICDKGRHGGGRHRPSMRVFLSAGKGRFVLKWVIS